MQNLSTSYKKGNNEKIFGNKSLININGTEKGLSLSVPSNIYNLSGIEYFARVLCGNIDGNKDFALNQLKKIAKVNNAVIVFNQQVIN